MFSKSSVLVFLAIALSVQAIPATPKNGMVALLTASASPNNNLVANDDCDNPVTASTSPTAAALVASPPATDGRDDPTIASASPSALALVASPVASPQPTDDNGGDDCGDPTIAGASPTADSGTASATVRLTKPTSAAAAAVPSSSGNPQTSLILDSRVIAAGFGQDGQGNITEPGQTASLTSTNNYINFCLTQPNVPITDGKQITTGSCNPAPMGFIPPSTNMPSAKFVSPKNLDTIQANQTFAVILAVKNLDTGNFVNANTNYYSAPQQLNSLKIIKGHTHIVIESLDSLDQTTPTDPTRFTTFKGVNTVAVNGQLNATIDDGLPAGQYKLSTINTAANHQPVLVPIAQRGSLDDSVYITVTDGNSANNTGQSGSGKRELHNRFNLKG